MKKKLFVSFLLIGIAIMAIAVSLLLNELYVGGVIVFLIANFVLGMADEYRKEYRGEMLGNLVDKLERIKARAEIGDVMSNACENDSHLRLMNEQTRFTEQQLLESQRMLDEQQRLTEQNMRLQQEAQPVEFGGNDWTQFIMHH